MLVERDLQATDPKGAAVRHAPFEGYIGFSLEDDGPQGAVGRTNPSADRTDPSGNRRARDGRGPARG